MIRNSQRRNTVLFIVFLLLAGTANQLSRTGNTVADALMSSVNDLIYIGLILFWLQSVRIRLLLSKARGYIVGCAVLMLLYLLVRIIKYKIVDDIVLIRYATYAYWVPQMLIPALFLMTCIRIRRGEARRGRWPESLLLIPGGVMAVLAMTNDLHRLIYRPNVDLSVFSIQTGTYSHGPGLYLLYAWMIAATVSGIFLLIRETGHRPGKVIRSLLLMAGLWYGLVLLNLLVLDKIQNFRFFNVPEIHIFSMLGIIEICIRHRLIRYNENYSGFFRLLRMPVLITDRQFRPVYASASEIPADTDTLRRSLAEPVAIPPDRKLYGSGIRAGYAFHAEDESAVHAAQQRLRTANSLIEQENDLIRAETEQRERDAHIQSRHRIYHEIAGQLYPCQKRIGQILDGMQPGAADFRDRIALVSVLNAYVKRKTNLLLLAAENETLSTGELHLALQESAGYLSLAGLTTTAVKPEERQYPADRLILLYDTFEALAEQLLGKASSMMVSWTADGLCMATQADQSPDPAGVPLPVRFRVAEDTLYMDISAEKGGERA